MAVKLVDTSHYDYDRRGSPLDWAHILGATSPAMMCKQTEGDPAGYHFSDPKGATALQAAAAAGAKLRGGYHCPSHGDQASINRQVDYFRAALDTGGATWAMLDVEPFAELGANWPRWDDVMRFADRWHQLEQRVLSGYVPQWFWSDQLGRPDLTQFPGPLISSTYGDDAAMAPDPLYQHVGGDGGAGWGGYGGRVPDLWQYGSRCVVSGASDQSDINAYRGTFDQLTQLLTAGGSMAGYSNRVDPDALTNDYRTYAVSNQLTPVQFPGISKSVSTDGKDYPAGPIDVPYVTQFQQLRADVKQLTDAVASGVPITLTDEQLDALADRLAPKVAAALAPLLRGTWSISPPAALEIQVELD